MKKSLFLFMIVALSAMMGAQAQSLDTVYGRQPEYYYTYWYDTCLWYTDPDSAAMRRSSAIVFMHNSYWTDSTMDLVAQMKTDYPLNVKGVALMVSNCLINPDHPATTQSASGRVYDTIKMPEYVYLLREEEDGTGDGYYLSVVDSARWDTLQPKIYCLDPTADGRYAPHCCYIYEVMFASEHLVDGCFAIAGSTNSNVMEKLDGMGGQNLWWKYYPTIYLTFGDANEDYGLRQNSHYSKHHRTPQNPRRWQYKCDTTTSGSITEYFRGYGPFAAITDPVHVRLAMSCPSCGRVEGMGTYPVGSTQTIRAIPNDDYHFSHWSDGDDSNPRTLVVTEDISLVAYFEKGDVGIADTEKDVPFTVHPNPSHGMVTVDLHLTETTTLRVVDAAGKEVAQRAVGAADSSIDLDLRHLSAGVYYITLDSPSAPVAQRLVLQ